MVDRALKSKNSLPLLPATETANKCLPQTDGEQVTDSVRDDLAWPECASDCLLFLMSDTRTSEGECSRAFLSQHGLVQKATGIFVMQSLETKHH